VSPARAPAAGLGAGVRAVFTDRNGGVSLPPFESLNLAAGVGDEPVAVAANRDRLARSQGLQAAGIAWMRQVHSAAVRYVGRGSAGRGFADGGPVGRGPAGGGPVGRGSVGLLADPVDAQYTDVPGVALAVLVADCLPVLLADPEARVVGAAHSGREGTAAGVVPALVSAMTEAGASPARMRARIGPAICGGCYEVPAALRDRVSAKVPAAWCATRDGTPGLDLAAAVRAQLAELGVREVATDGRCTKESAELFSYRRDGQTGRFAGLVWLLP
jgi:polyphenol oxidase